MLTEKQKAIILKFLPILNEAQRRWFVAKEAMAIGRGGIEYMHELTNISRPTIIRGCKELNEKEFDLSLGVRSSGGGRPTVDDRDPKLTGAILKIMHETTAGDPMSALRWTCKSTTKIAEELIKQGHSISQRSVHRKLCDLGYSLQLNVKHKEGTHKSTKDRDSQFKTINVIVADFMKKNYPVISVDTKKKEKVGEFKNNGRVWLPKGEPHKVNVYDFPSLAKGNAIPYGAYDVGRNEGFVNILVSPKFFALDHRLRDFSNPEYVAESSERHIYQSYVTGIFHEA